MPTRQQLPRATRIGMPTTIPPFVISVDDAARLSDELRHTDAPGLRHRRRAVALSTACAGIMGYLTLYQTGVTKRLLEVPIKPFDANVVDVSAQAYQLLGVPDAPVGVASYAATAVTAAMGGARPARWQRAAFVAKVALDTYWGTKLAVDQLTKHKALCSWCLITTGLTWWTLREAIAAARAPR